MGILSGSNFMAVAETASAHALLHIASSRRSRCADSSGCGRQIVLCAGSQASARQFSVKEYGSIISLGDGLPLRTPAFSFGCICRICLIGSQILHQPYGNRPHHLQRDRLAPALATWDLCRDARWASCSLRSCQLHRDKGSSRHLLRQSWVAIAGALARTPEPLVRNF